MVSTTEIVNYEETKIAKKRRRTPFQLQEHDKEKVQRKMKENKVFVSAMLQWNEEMK